MNRRDFLGWVDTAETWPEYVKRIRRRERIEEIVGRFLIVLACLAAVAALSVNGCGT